MAEVPPLQTLPGYELILPINEIVQPLRFHTAEAYRMIHKHELLNYLNHVPLIGDKDLLIPFTLSCEKTHTTYNDLTTAEVINNRTNQVIDLLPYITTTQYLDNSTNPTRLYIQYWNTMSDQFTSLKHGIYYLHFKNDDGEWWSDCFKIGFFEKTVTFLYQPSYSFSGIPIRNLKTWKAVYEAIFTDTGEYQKHSVFNKDQDNYDVYSYERFDKIRNINIHIGDSNVMDVLNLIQAVSHRKDDIVYIIDEVGKTVPVEITEISSQPIGASNYMNIIVKYRVRYNGVNTSDRRPISTTGYTQYPPDIPVPELTGETFDDKFETFDDKTETFNQ